MKELLHKLKPKEKKLNTPLIDKLDLREGRKPTVVFELRKHLMKVITD